jgi:phosphotriesterase-related protein
MATVESVSGPIDVDELGTTLIHEHFRFRDEGAAFQWPHLYDEKDEMEKALADARGVMSHGVKTVVDPNAMTGSRDARFSKRVADETGLQIILATGI